MTLYRFDGKEPRIGERTYVSSSAEVIGDVEIGGQCYIGPGAKIRGDYGRIAIGNGTSIEENCVLHARPNEACEVGSLVTVGHGSILHNCTVKDYAIIGMGAIDQVIEDRKVAVGVPARIAGEITDEYQNLWTKYKNIYVELAKKYHERLQQLV